MLDTYFLLFGRNGYWFFLEAFWDLITGEEMGCETTWRKIFFQTLPQADPAAWRGTITKSESLFVTCAASDSG
jgi:hypothetical protein